MIRTQLLTTKNSLWKDISWLSRKSYLYQNYNQRRGRSYAQIGTEAGGYGYRRNPYEGALHDKVKEMRQAFDDVVPEFNDLFVTSYKELQNRLGGAIDDFQSTQDAKAQDLQDFIDSQRHKLADNIMERTETVLGAID